MAKYRYTIKELNEFSHSTAKKLAKAQGTPRREHPSYDEISHPRCETVGCDCPKTVMDWHWTSGKPVYRSVCTRCHDANTARKYAAKHSDAEWVRTVVDVCAHKEGFKTVADWSNSKHPYRQYRRDYCENIDGRLGYMCTTNTSIWTGVLDVDHIDGNPSNNTEKNLQTLCKCCHAYKTNIYKDYATDGRKTLGCV